MPFRSNESVAGYGARAAEESQSAWFLPRIHRRGDLGDRVFSGPRAKNMNQRDARREGWRGALEVCVADITTLEVDVIVNAANERMLGGGGVDGAIHEAAGPQLYEACLAVPEIRPGVRCPTGEARITPGFALPARHVIHTVGPIWGGGDHGERDLLASCYRQSLSLAARHGLRSIAFSAISTGVYGFPKESAAEIAVAECRDFLMEAWTLERVLLVAFQESQARILRSALARLDPSTGTSRSPDT